MNFCPFEKGPSYPPQGERERALVCARGRCESFACVHDHARDTHATEIATAAMVASRWIVIAGGGFPREGRLACLISGRNRVRDCASPRAGLAKRVPLSRDAIRNKGGCWGYLLQCASRSGRCLGDSLLSSSSSSLRGHTHTHAYAAVRENPQTRKHPT